MKFLENVLLLIALLGCFDLEAQSGPIVGQNPTVKLAWDYPTNYFVWLQGQASVVTNPVAYAAMTNVGWNIWSATNLTGTNTQWSLVLTTNNPAVTTNGAWAGYIASVPTVPGSWQNFYAISWWNASGASFFSGLAATPISIPSQGNFSVQFQLH